MDDQSARLRHRTEELAQLGIWQFCPATGELLWSDNLFRVFGAEPGAIVPSPEWVLEQSHPDDRQRLQLHLARMARGESVPAVEFRVTVGSGDTRWLRSSVALNEHATTGLNWLSGVIQDVSERAWAHQQAELHAAVAHATIEWVTFEASADRLLEGLARALSFELGVLWLPEGRSLRASTIWRTESIPVELALRIQKLRLSAGEGLAGRGWQLHRPLNIANIVIEPSYEPREEAIAAGLRGAVAVPLLYDADVLAVMTLASRAPEQLSVAMMAVLSELGSELGRFLSRRPAQLAAATLSPRDLEILKLAAGGLSVQDISEQLTISPSTVKGHFEQIYRKLQVSGRASAVAYGLRSGMIE